MRFEQTDWNAIFLNFDWKLDLLSGFAKPEHILNGLSLNDGQRKLDVLDGARRINQP